MTNLEAALKYASWGWKVFPCNPDKTPATNNGFYDGTNDANQIKRWWTETPDALIGMATGALSGVWVVDFDEYKQPGLRELFQKTHGRLTANTLIQQTARGGYHYFWKYNGTEIKSRNGKLFKYVDVKADGGYVILPPSANDQGKKYRWITSVKPAEPEAWLVELARKEDEPSPKPQRECTGTTKYGQVALLSEIRILRSAEDGNRNEQLNKSSYAIGQLVAGGEIDQFEAELQLTTAATMLGLEPKEIPATMRSGMTSGQKYQRSAPEKREYYFDLDEVEKSVSTVSTVSSVNQVSPSKQTVSTEPNLVSSGKQEVSTGIRDKSINLACQIREWIINSTGSFTTEQLDREFCLTTREDKNNRAKCLSIYSNKENNLIRKDRRVKGKWHVIDSNVTWVDLNQESESSFPIFLPFDLHEKVSVPPKSIVVLAGSTNAGKTAFILNTLRLNIDQEYEKMYLMSEMGGSEYKDRVLKFGDPIDLWNKNIKAAPKSSDFDGMIQHYNPNGLTCIDFLEEIEGEYFKIASSIRDIYDALSDGVAFIAIQKKRDQLFARGGEATAEKARLYMSVDYLCSVEHAIICSLKIVKVKKSIQENMVDKEIHFRIEKGACLTPVSDWMPSSRVNRDKCIMKYSEGVENDSDIIHFKTEAGRTVRVLKSNIDLWQDHMPNIDVRKELEKISADSFKRPFLNNGKWFMQVGGILKKIDNERR